MDRLRGSRIPSPMAPPTQPSDIQWASVIEVGTLNRNVDCAALFACCRAYELATADSILDLCSCFDCQPHSLLVRCQPSGITLSDAVSVGGLPPSLALGDLVGMPGFGTTVVFLNLGRMSGIVRSLNLIGVLAAPLRSFGISEPNLFCMIFLVLSAGFVANDSFGSTVSTVGSVVGFSVHCKVLLLLLSQAGPAACFHANARLDTVHANWLGFPAHRTRLRGGKRSIIQLHRASPSLVARPASCATTVRASSRQLYQLTGSDDLTWAEENGFLDEAMQVRGTAA